MTAKQTPTANTDGAVSMCPQDYFFLKWAIHDVNTIQEYWNTTTLTMDVVEKNNGKLLKENIAERRGPFFFRCCKRLLRQLATIRL